MSKGPRGKAGLYRSKHLWGLFILTNGKGTAQYFRDLRAYFNDDNFYKVVNFRGFKAVFLFRNAEEISQALGLLIKRAKLIVSWPES